MAETYNPYVVVLSDSWGPAQCVMAGSYMDAVRKMDIARADGWDATALPVVDHVQDLPAIVFRPNPARRP